jgi:hypothetical protein
MSCAAPIPFETLVELWTGELAEDQAGAIEEHVFSCDTCAALSARLARLTTRLRELIPPVISQAHKERLEKGGLRIHVTPALAGELVHVRFSADRDLLVHALRGDFTAVDRVDLEVGTDDDPPRIHVTAAPFDAARGEVLIACQRHYQELGDLVYFQMHVVKDGVRQPAGRYRVHHEWS